jgi:hypothetical protein
MVRVMVFNTINTGLDIADYVDKDLVSSVFVRTVNLLDDGLLDVTQPELTEEVLY